MQASINEAIINLEKNKVFHLSNEHLKPTMRLVSDGESKFPFSLGFVLRDESGNPIESIHAAFGTIQGIQRYLEILFMFCRELKKGTYWETLDEGNKMVIEEVLATKELYDKKFEGLTNEK